MFAVSTVMFKTPTTSSQFVWQFATFSEGLDSTEFPQDQLTNIRFNTIGAQSRPGMHFAAEDIGGCRFVVE